MEKQNITAFDGEDISKRFLNQGSHSLTNKELFTFLLYFIQPRSCLTASNQLLTENGEVSELIDLSREELKKIDSLTDTSIGIINLLSEVVRVYSLETGLGELFDSTDKLRRFFHSFFIGVKQEQVLLLCLDDEMRGAAVHIVGNGGFSTVNIDNRGMTEKLIAAGCTSAVIAHNHPTSISRPSFADITATRAISSSMSHLGLSLCDHIIIGRDGSYSMKEHKDY